MRCYPGNTEATDGELSASFTWFCSRAAPCREYHIEKRKDERYFMFIEILTLRMCVIKFFAL